MSAGDSAERHLTAGHRLLLAVTALLCAVAFFLTGSLVVPSFLILAAGIRIFYGPRASSVAPLVACAITVLATEGWRHIV